ncbi:tetratricopeptide repeat protein [Cuniculiplasma sp. SKW3]|uniref:tetratricopeptide repeat protein n=1 Tax=Cuniculiplasma sp. SKW3 TaxID=3400170 RepID=UPI003FD04CEF
MTTYEEQIGKGFELLSSGEYEKSLEYFLKAIEMDSSRADAFSLASEAYVEMGELEKAKTHSETAYSLDKNKPELALQYASILMALGDMKKSMTLVNEVLKQKDMVEAHYVKSNIYDNMGESKKALIEAEIAYKNGNNPEYGINFCRILENDGKIEESVKILKDIIKADPQNLEVAYMLFRDSIALDKIADALKYIMECISIDDEQPAFYLDLGSLLDELDDEKLAEKYYNKAVEISQDDPEPLMDIAEFYLDRGNYERALEKIEAALALDEDAKDAYIIKGKILESMDNFEKATESFRKAQEIEEDEEAALHEAICLYKLDKMDLAEQIFNNLLEKEFQDEIVRSYLDRIWWRRNKKKYKL